MSLGVAFGEHLWGICDGYCQKYAPSSSNSVCRLKVSCVVYVAQLLLRVLISASCLGHLAFRVPVAGLGRLRTARRYLARPPGFRPSATVASIISAMAKKKSPADRLRARAREVRHDASYGGIFLLTYAIRITRTPLRTGQYLEKRWLHDLWVCHVIRLELRPRPCAETLW